MERFLAVVAISMWATAAVYAEDDYIYWIPSGISSGRPLVTDYGGYPVVRMTITAGVLLPGYASGTTFYGALGGVSYEITNGDFEMLVYTEEQGTSLVYVASDSVEGVPPGAVIGGHTQDAYPLYIIRADITIGFFQDICFGNYDARNDYAETLCTYATQHTVFEFMVLVHGETVVIMEDHMGPLMLINRGDGSTRETQSLLNDPLSNTCVQIEMARSMLLQAVFSFPSSQINQQMSVQVKLRHAEGSCTSAVSDWFVESECAAGSFRECDQQLVSVAAPFTYCKITCQCLFTCDFLYLKSHHIPSGTLEYEICDVKLLYAAVEPGVGQ